MRCTDLPGFAAKLIFCLTQCTVVGERGGGLRLTVRERMLVHLKDHAARAEAYPAPVEITQAGLAAAVGIERRHLPQYIRPLIAEGLVVERSAPVVGGRQRRKTYALTFAGRKEAVRLQEWAKTERIRVREGDGIRETSVAEFLENSGRKVSLVEVARQVAEMGVVELESSAPSPSSLFVAQISDAPRVEVFLGRRRELDEVVRDSEGPRVFVVRGVAGIGKSSFAAKACELMRGRKNLFWHRIRPWDSLPIVLANLGRFLSALDRPGLVAVLSRGQVARAAEVLRQDLPGTHSFLVFDDAQVASPDLLTVFQMLAEAVADAPDVRMLILSRRALPFYNRRDVVLGGLLREIELGGLSSEEAAALLAVGGEPSALVGVGRKLAGHPLFLELVRAHRPETSRALGDVRRFIEEEIYVKLSEAERTIMKLGSLYRVPVPGTALLAGSELSFETLVALQDQLLLRRVGEDHYEIHDTIRDFFAGVLASKERERFGVLAVAQLRVLADNASASGDAAGRVAYLSNALQIAQPREERAVLSESLGDANEGIGDMLGLSAAYRTAMALTSDAPTLTRLHRKLASSLEDRGQLDAASAEVDAGFIALGDGASVERGWLYLVRARIANGTYNYPSAEAYAETALQAFERSGERLGQARTLLEAGKAAIWTGTLSEDGTPAAGRRFEAALEVASSLGDPRLEARIRIAIAIAIGYGSGDYEAGTAQWRAIESSPAMADPNVRSEMHLERAWFLLRIRRDYEAAESELLEAARVARKIHDDRTLADVDYQSAVMALQQGRYSEAGRLDEEAGSEMAQVGITGFAANAYFGAVHSYLAAGDWDGYQRAASALKTPSLERGLKQDTINWLSHQAMESVIRGDLVEFEHASAELFRYAEAIPARSLWRTTRLWWGHFYYSVALRALGRDREAEEHRLRALELVRSANNLQAVQTIESDLGGRIAETVRGGRKPP